ncbi:MAG TPA: glutathionylspermidine synthase family protein [Candidatus Elarobacter sp.]|jgi:glutathionylspermidine synthase|nr:glutathionylspermidine synthase family protein [Candidatus Elarobacter sp.]
MRERTAAAAEPVAFWESYEGHPYALPDAVVLEAAEVDAIREAARDAWSVYVRAAELLRALPDEGLHALGIPAAAFDIVRRRDARAGETLVGRFDFLREGDAYRVVELNAETPFFVVESFVESGRRARAAGLRDPNAGQRELLGDALAAALQPLDRAARIGVVATNVYREDVGTACFLRDLIAERVGAEVVFVPVHELAVEDGAVLDASGPLDVLYRCYPLEHFAADPDGAALFEAVARGACRMLNPPSALLLQSKAAQALIWGLYERGAYFEANERAAIARTFLPTYLDRPDDGATYVRKPVLGREGIGVTIVDGAGAEIAHGERAVPAIAEQPVVYQRYVRAPRRRVRRADGESVDGEELTTCFVAGGRPSAVGMRIGGAVTDSRSFFAPVGVR